MRKAVVILYHASYKAKLTSIMRCGISRCADEFPAYPDCNHNFVYLTMDRECAVSFCESSDDVPEEWLGEIVVISVEAESLNCSLLALDENMLGASRLTSFQYNGDIPASAFLAVEDA